ncbi:MAG: Tfp pilus assembly protein PilX [Bradymonadia bacterium]|jgi:Tfp pilus assembly protein PilX
MIDRKLTSTATLLFALTLLVLGACAKGPTDKLIGAWALDSDATFALMADGIPEAEHEIVQAGIASLSMTMTFTADTAILNMGGNASNATYTATEGDGDALNLSVLEEGDEEAEESVLRFSGDDQFSMTIGNDTMVFSRQ